MFCAKAQEQRAEATQPQAGQESAQGMRQHAGTTTCTAIRESEQAQGGGTESCGCGTGPGTLRCTSGGHFPYSGSCGATPRAPARGRLRPRPWYGVESAGGWQVRGASAARPVRAWKGCGGRSAARTLATGWSDAGSRHAAPGQHGARCGRVLVNSLRVWEDSQRLSPGTKVLSLLALQKRKPSRQRLRDASVCSGPAR